MKHNIEEIKTFGELLLEKAGVEYIPENERVVNEALDIDSQTIVDKLMDTMLSLRCAKTKSYGDRRFNGLRSDQVEKAMFFCDLQRKMDRLEAIIFNNDKSTVEDIIDAVSDMVGNSMMALETTYYMWKRDQDLKEG